MPNDSLNQVNTNLGGFSPVIDETGKITGYKTKAGADTVFPFKSFSIDDPILAEYMSKASANSSEYLNTNSIEACGKQYINSEYFSIVSHALITAKKPFSARFVCHFYNSSTNTCTFTIYKNDEVIGSLSLERITTNEGYYNMMNIRSNAFYTFDVEFNTNDHIKILPSTWSGNYFGTGVYLVATEI